MNVNLISIIAAVIILALLIIAVFFTLKKKSGTKKAIGFLNGLGDELLKVILNSIKHANPLEYSSLDEFEVVVLKNIYDNCWLYVYEQINKQFENTSTIRIIFDIVDKDFVIKFINEIIEKSGISEQIKDSYNTTYKLEENKGNTEEEDLEEKFSDQTQYVEESNNDDLEPAKVIVHTDDDYAELNPQKDEEEQFDINDDSMELITEDGPEILVTADKNGNTLYYEITEDGKKKRVTKEYALKYLDKQ